MPEAKLNLFEQFQKLTGLLQQIRSESQLDTASSELSDDEVARIENPTLENFSDITLSQLSSYIFTLGHELTFTQSGTSKLSAEPARLVLGLRPVPSKVLSIDLV